MSPVLSVITGTNGDLIRHAGELWIKPTDSVLDMTYGRGNFWTQYVTGSGFVTNDLYSPEAFYHHDFTALPHTWAAAFDVAVFDPPYVTTGGKKTSTVKDMHASYGTGETGPKTQDELFELIDAGVGEAARVLKPRGRLFVKCMDYVESGHMVWMHKHVQAVGAAYVGEQVDEFVHHSGTGPQPLTNRDGTPRRQIHSRRAHSFLCVFQAPSARKKARNG